MKLDLFYEFQVPKPWPEDSIDGQREAEQKVYREAMEQIQLADKVGGWNGVWLVEHHFREGRSHCPAPEVVLGALSQTTSRLRLGFGVTLIPHGFTHPARVAEKVATVDVLSGGRVEWGTGRSTPMERQSFGVPEGAASKASMAEAIRNVADMWTEEYFERHNEFIDFPRRRVTPRPVQTPHPPAWMAAVSESSYELAGRYGMGLLGLTTRYTVKEIKELIDRYRAAIENPEPLTRVVNNQAMIYTLVHCAPTLGEAEGYGIWDAVWWWYQHLAEFMLQWEFPHLPEEEQHKMFPLLRDRADGKFDPRDFNDEDMIIIGDEDTCLEKMQRVAEAGADRLACFVQFGKLSHETIMRTIETIGTKIAPKLE